VSAKFGIISCFSESDATRPNDLAAGNRLELDWLAGKVVALGRKYGIPTPGQEAVYAMLKPYRMGRIR
jgi:2-dehydropantoate 2-reductase